MNTTIKNTHPIGWFTSPSKIFLVISSLFGVLIMLVLPLFAAPDEPAHFYRAYQISKLNFTSHTTSTGDLGGIVAEIPYTKNYYGVKIPQDKFVSFPNSATYSPVSYIPQSIGIGIARTIGLPFGYMVIFGRFLNLVLFIASVYVAIRIAPVGRWVYCVVALFPIAIQQAASLSVDSITIGLAFITIATFQKIYFQKTKINKQDFVILALLATGIALTKANSLLLFAPIFFIPKRIFISIRQKIALIFMVIGSAIAASTIWTSIIRLKAYNTNPAKTLGMVTVNQVEQLQHIINSPFSIVKVIFKSYIFQGFNGQALPDFYLLSAHGYFSNFLYRLPLALIFLGYLVLIIALLYDVKGEARSKSLAVTQMIVFVFAVLSTGVALYLLWTPVGAPQIDGVQGRYFIPFIPLLIPIFIYAKQWVKVSIKSEKTMGIIVGTVSCFNLSAMIALTYIWFK